MVFFSTSVIQGNGLGVVVQTGDKTIMGHIANLVSNLHSGETPIKKVQYRIPAYYTHWIPSIYLWQSMYCTLFLPDLKLSTLNRIKITHDKRYRLPTIPGKDKIFLQVYFAIFFENLLIQIDKYNKNMSSKFSYNTFLFSFLNVPRYIAWLLFQLSLFLCNMCSEHLHNWAAYDLLSARTQYPRASTNVYM